MNALCRLASTSALAALITVSTPAIASAQTFDSGHIDAFNVNAPSADSLELALKEDITGSHVVRAPEDVVIRIPDHALTDATQSVPGVERSTWYLPQTQVADLPWPGWDTNGVRESGFEAIDLNFVSVDGPGNVFLYLQDTFGSPMSATTDGGLWLHSGSVITQDHPAHVHANWGFDTPGTYTMRVNASGVNPSGALVQSNTATYTFSVGDESAERGAAPAESGGAAPGAAEGSSQAGGAAPSAGGAAPAASGKAGDAPGVTGHAPAGRANSASGKSASPAKAFTPAGEATSNGPLGISRSTWIFFAVALLLLAIGCYLYFFQRPGSKRATVAADGSTPAHKDIFAPNSTPASPADPQTSIFPPQDYRR